MVSACRLITWQVLDLSVCILFFPYLYLKVQRTGCKSLLWHSHLHQGGTVRTRSQSITRLLFHKRLMTRRVWKWGPQHSNSPPSCSSRNILFSFTTMNSIFFLEMICIFCCKAIYDFFYRIYSIKFIFCKMSYSVDVIYNDVHHLFPRF